MITEGKKKTGDGRGIGREEDEKRGLGDGGLCRAAMLEEK
jgi:hypothetical protein